MPWCRHCKGVFPNDRSDEGFLCCSGCGRVIDMDMFSTEITFFKNAGGQSQLSGNFVKSVESDYSTSHARTLEKGRDEISNLVDSLDISGGNSVIDPASAFYRIAVERNFTRGRRTSLVAAACLYIVCRESKKEFLLIDFSEILQTNVYVLGAVFLQLCKLLRLEEHPIVQKPVDPSLFIHRFTNGLLRDNKDMNSEVSRTALRIIASMKRDWMQTGRKPSGLCGAALYISALSHGLKYSKSDIVSVVHICEATLTRRLIEFENTESGSLTIEEFNTTAEELERESRSRKQPNVGTKPSGERELLCEHKGTDKPHFAHGLCKSCYDDFITLSGGLQGGSEPPAFQRAQRERVTKAPTEKNAKESSLFEKETEPSSNPKHDVIGNEKVSSRGLESSGAASGDQAGDEGTSGQSHRSDDMDNMTGNESESLSDIDDVEVDGYLHNEEEKRFKKIIWEEMNREYLEEQAAKEAAAAAAKEAYEAHFQNCSEDLLAAQELAAAAAAAVAKSRKERQQQRAAEAKNAAPAQSAAEAARQMLTKKRLSSKINYDVLDSLFSDTKASENTKKKRIESDSSDEASERQHSKKKKEDSDVVDNVDDIGMQGDEYGEEDNAGEKYGDDLYYGNEEEYGYEDYGYEF